MVNTDEPGNLRAISSQHEEEAFLKFTAPRIISLLFSVVANVGSFFFLKMQIFYCDQYF